MVLIDIFRNINLLVFPEHLFSRKFNFHNNYVIGAKGTYPYDCLQIPGAETENGNCVHSQEVKAPDSFCAEV